MRYSNWAITAIAASLAALSPLSGAAAKQQVWPQTYYDSGHSGFNQSESKLSAKNVKTLQLRWGQSSGMNGPLALVVDKGTLYVQDRDNGDGNQQIFAVNPGTGDINWSVTQQKSGYGYPVSTAAAGGLIFAECGTVDSDGRVDGICAYAESDGHAVWQYFSPCNCVPESDLDTPLTYANGTLYFGYGYGNGSGYSNYIVALNAKNGKQRWGYYAGGNNALAGAAPAVSGGKVYYACGTYGGTVCALSQKDGTFLWASSATRSYGANYISAGKDAVYFSSCASGLTALDPATGQQRWSFANQSCGSGPVGFTGNDVYYSGDYLYDLDATDGHQKWVTTGQGPLSSPSIANGVVYIVGGTAQDGSQASASAYSAKNGKELWATPQGNPWVTPLPVIANAMLFDGADRSCGQICAYSLAGKQ